MINYMIYYINSSDAAGWWDIETIDTNTITESSDSWDTNETNSNGPFDIDHVYVALNLTGETQDDTYDADFSIRGTVDSDDPYPFEQQNTWIDYEIHVYMCNSTCGGDCEYDFEAERLLRCCGDLIR